MYRSLFFSVGTVTLASVAQLGRTMMLQHNSIMGPCCAALTSSRMGGYASHHHATQDSSCQTLLLTVTAQSDCPLIGLF